MEIKSREIVGNEPSPHLLITGGVHGDEFEPIAAIHQLMERVDARTLRGRVTLVPVVNEPAFYRGSRTAEDGLDLARVCPGKPDGSVTEQIAHEVSRLIRTADYYIDLHTGGTELCVLPLVGYKMHPDKDVLERQRKMARAFNLPIIWGTHPGLDGRTLSIARDAGIPAIYAEYLGAARCHADGVTAYVEGCLNVLGALEMIDREQPASIVERIIEDDREQSGFMQICNTSPMTGFFKPAVALGDFVKSGDRLGTVTDLINVERKDIISQQTGIVLVLHTFSRVREGVGLAVILETERGS